MPHPRLLNLALYLFFWNKRFACNLAAMSVRYLLLALPHWDRIREEETGETERDIKALLGTREGATVATTYDDPANRAARAVQGDDTRRAGATQERRKRNVCGGG